MSVAMIEGFIPNYHLQKATLADSNKEKVWLDLVWAFTRVDTSLKDTKKIEVIVTDSNNKTLNYTYYEDNA
jgi:hypothetical protein